MEKILVAKGIPIVGGHLGRLVRIGSFGGLFFSGIGTVLIWAGSDSFGLPSAVWAVSILLNLAMFLATWVCYVPFRKTDNLLGHGILSIFILFSFFWLFGYSMFFFYFLFSPIDLTTRVAVLVTVSTMLGYRVFLIFRDIKSVFEKNTGLFHTMYVKEGDNLTFTRDSVGYLERARPERSPFKSFHSYAAMVTTPFVLVLNRMLTPYAGDGHGIFIVLAFFSVPIMLWGVGVVVQTVVTMICIPLKIWRQTGKHILLKDW
jgi:hypothetical protein